MRKVATDLLLTLFLFAAAAVTADHTHGQTPATPRPSILTASTRSAVAATTPAGLPVRRLDAPPDLAAAVTKAASPAMPAADTKAIVLLLLLYTLQGIPMGLGAVIPMLLLERGATAMELAVFSIVAFPFAIKLLWAPLVDSIYSARFGRRKTWIVPMQGLIGLMMLVAGGRVDAILGPVEGGAKVNVRMLTGLFLAFYALAATQDIAVDGLALTILSPANRELGATCNAIGQTLGTFLAYVIFILLHSRGLISLGAFMQLWGGAFVASIAAVLLMAGNDEYSHPGDDSGRPMLAQAAVRVFTTYREMASVLLLPAVRELAFVLLTARVPFAAADVLLPLELLSNGVRKEQIALLSTILLPISMAAQATVSRFFRSGAPPLRVFVYASAGRLLQGILAIGLVGALRRVTAAGGVVPFWLLFSSFVVLAFGALAAASMFVAQMAFFNRVSDARIGGTYLTMLNTLANLGAQWPGTIALAAKGSIDKAGGADGFYVVASGSLVVGAVWLALMHRRIAALQDRPAESWLAHDAGVDGE